MSSPSAPKVAAVPLLLLLGLAGCTAPQPEAETYVSGADAPIDAPAAVDVTPNPIEPDTTLVVTATATAPNGAVLALELQVHQASPWDYPGTQTLPGALIQDCGALVDDEVFASQGWAFTRVNITAIPTGESTADWPADAPISVEPSARYAMIAGRGMLASSADASTNLCFTDKLVTSAGKGALSMGIPGDAATLTGWSRHAFGFTGTDVEFTDCTLEPTALGASLGAQNMTAVMDDTTCVIGPSTQTNEY